MKDKELDNLEKLIPSLATGAVKKAYLDALSSGYSVLEVINGVLYEVFANGDKKKIKDLPPTIKVDMSTKVQL